MAFFEGCPVGWGGVPFWPGGRGGRPRALIPGEGVREGLAWRGKAEWVSNAYKKKKNGVF